jgi:nucleoside-diphosphate-sugar epimerase
MPFVLVQGVAEAMVLALDAPGIEGKAFNLAGDVFISARDYVRIAAERTKPCREPEENEFRSLAVP